MSEIDALFITPPSRLEVYQGLSNEYAAIEPPVWSSLIANYLLKRNYIVEILDSEAENLTHDQTTEKILTINPKLAIFMIYGQQPSASTQCMSSGRKTCLKLNELSSKAIKTIVVGTHSSALPKKTLDEEPYDFVCQGEGPLTIEKLIEFKIIPIINENDVVSTEELEGEKFGDNDTLSAFVSNIIDANLLIILSSIEGLFTTDPNRYPQSAKLISEIKNVGIRDIDSLGGPTTNNRGTGGMNTKLKAIELASVSGTDVIIASGKNPDNILKIINGEKIGTFFPAKLKIIERKKRWLLNNMSRSKSLTVDEGAKNAILQNNTSLLPPGIISVSGSFKAGEVVCILDKKKQLIACGITSYSNKEINKIKGKQSTDIINNLGYIHTEEIIHKNNLVNL